MGKRVKYAHDILIQEGDLIMIIQFILEDSCFDCNFRIRDLQGERDYYIRSAISENMQFNYLDIEVFGSDFDLSVIPIIPDYKKDINNEKVKGLRDKLVKKASSKIFLTCIDMLLRIGCTYQIKGLSNGDVVNIKSKQYVFGIIDRYDLLGLLPMVYMFYEVSYGGKRFELKNAFGVNRKEVIKTARIILLMNFGINLIFTYPFQIIRVKHLTKNRKVNKILMMFNCMNDKQRQKLIDKQENFLNNLY